MAKEYKAASLKITLKKSLIGCKDNQIATAAALGLKKIGSTVTQPNSVQTMGKINKIAHLVEVTEA